MSTPNRHLLIMNKECPVLVILQEPPINESKIYIRGCIRSQNESYEGPIKIIYAKNCERWSYYIANDDDKDLTGAGTEVSYRNGYKKVKSKFRNNEFEIQEDFSTNILGFEELMDKIDVEESFLEHSTPESEVTINNGTVPNDKFQCDLCSQIFTKASNFTRHMKRNHNSSNFNQNDNLVCNFNNYIYDCDTKKYKCKKCVKTFTTQENCRDHVEGHGNPERQCPVCSKILCNKYSLRNHMHIHNKSEINKAQNHTSSNVLEEVNIITYPADPVLSVNNAKVPVRKFQSATIQVINNGLGTYEPFVDDLIQTSTTHLPLLNDILDISEEDMLANEAIIATNENSQPRGIDPVISQILANDFFLTKHKKHKKYNKTCNVCEKAFTRIGDLKRHLIEHIIKRSLSKNPVSADGALNLLCQVCFKITFPSIDKYKAHLREHAKLTLYQCRYCDKSFSDSSNFSKHKKVHGHKYYQCETCKRKFNSKKMIAQHMEYHLKNAPFPCPYCDKICHFQSTLNKHIKFTHCKTPQTRYHCKFCDTHFSALKGKWDHEWRVHNLRKTVNDCTECDSKFRKFMELKRHCAVQHGIDLPTLKNYLKMLPTEL